MLIGIIVALAAGAAGGYYAGYSAGMSARGLCLSAEETLAPGENVLDIAEEANPFADIQEEVNPFGSGYQNPFATE